MVGGSSPEEFGRFVRRVLRERVVDLGSLSWSLRLLALLGYASVAFMLGVTAFLELTNAGMPGVEFRSESLGKVLRVPVPAMFFAALSLALGWAFLLTGASDCRRRVFLPVAFLFLSQWILFAPAKGALAPLIGLGGILVIGAVARRMARSWAYWRDLPLFEFGAWSAFMIVALAGLFFGEGRGQAATDLESAFILPQIIAVPFWVLLGVEAVDAAANLARVVVVRLRRRFSETRFGTLVVAVLLIRPVISAALILNDGGWWGIDFLVSVLLLLWALGLRLSGRLSVPAASLLLAISLVLPVLILGSSQPFREADLTTEALSVAGVATNVLPAALIFVGLAAYDVLNFGARYANVDGRIMPRGGRVLMYFGVVLLVTAFTLFFLNARVISTGQPDQSLELFIDMPFFIGILFLGLPYLAWMAWRRREKLIGSESASLGSDPLAS
jgi:hypothetical protein